MLPTVQKTWDDVFDRLGRASVQNHPDFIAIIERIYRCRHLRMVLDGPSGIPAYRVSTPLSGCKITTSPFNYYPPLMGSVDDLAALRSLISRAKKFGEKWYVEYKSFTPLSAEQIAELELQYYVPSVVSHVELLESYEGQEAQYRSSLRQNLRTTKRHAEEAGITIGWAENDRDLAQWYGLLVRLYRDKHRMICQPWSLYQAFHTSGMGRLLAAKKDGKVIGGIFILFSPAEWQYCWSAYEADYARLGLNTLLVDDAIRKAIKAGASHFDFGSSSPSDRDLIYFKSRWGCTDRPIYYYYWNHVPKPLDLDHSFTLARTIFAMLPISLLRRLPSLLVPLLA